MLFTSFTFVGFVLITLPLFYGVTRFAPTGARESLQTGILLVASVIFYAFANPALALLLIISTLGNVAVATALLNDGAPTQRRRAFVRVGVVLNLAILGAFKYAALLVGALLPASMEESFVPVLRDIPLPVGVSFFTFQGMSLVIDVYRGQPETVSALRGAASAGRGRYVANIALYIVFFPQLVAGPIVKAHEFVGQIGRKVARDIDLWGATRALTTGFFLKMVLADNLKEQTLALSVARFDGFTKIDMVLLAIAYSAQIFSDFAGYSLIAIGLAYLFGYRLPENFNSPYLSASITEFWRRWHISLSTWLREYLYIPLGGNRRGVSRTYINLMIVMVLGGLWHGASWNFAVWGLGHGLLLALERFFAGGVPGEPRNGATRLLRVGLTFTAVTVLWLPFSLPTLGNTIEFARHFADAPVGGPASVRRQLAFAVASFGLPVALYHFWHEGLLRIRTRVFVSKVAEPAILALCLFLIIVNAGSTGEFIYFQF